MEIFLISVITITASFVGTVTGFGIATILLPVLLLFYPLPASLLISGIVHIFNDIWHISLFKEGIRWKLIFEFGIPAFLASIIGASLVFSIPENATEVILGIFFMGYIVLLLLHSNFKIKHKAWTAVLGGAISGFIIGIFGVGGEIRAAFLSAFNLPKKVYIATIGAIALVGDIARVGTYFFGGVRISESLLYGMIIFIFMSYLGARIARRVMDKIPQTYFRNIILIFLFMISIKLLLF
ncbi:MAG: sulfite exporter TauE/SafE family protein [Candidatus Spechtbacterales bacterium]